MPRIPVPARTTPLEIDEPAGPARGAAAGRGSLHRRHDRERAQPTPSARRFPDSDAAEGVVDRYGEATNVRAFDGRADRLTEMDALVAYLQILGGLTDLATVAEALAEE